MELSLLLYKVILTFDIFSLLPCGPICNYPAKCLWPCFREARVERGLRECPPPWRAPGGRGWPEERCWKGPWGLWERKEEVSPAGSWGREDNSLLRPRQVLVLCPRWEGGEDSGPQVTSCSGGGAWENGKGDWYYRRASRVRLNFSSSWKRLL